VQSAIGGALRKMGIRIRPMSLKGTFPNVDFVQSGGLYCDHAAVLHARGCLN
jgi:hypothetical protein